MQHIHFQLVIPLILTHLLKVLENPSEEKDRTRKILRVQFLKRPRTAIATVCQNANELNNIKVISAHSISECVQIKKLLEV